jgi:hypothetical protein
LIFFPFTKCITLLLYPLYLLLLSFLWALSPTSPWLGLGPLPRTKGSGANGGYSYSPSTTTRRVQLVPAHASILPVWRRHPEGAISNPIREVVVSSNRIWTTYFGIRSSPCRLPSPQTNMGYLRLTGCVASSHSPCLDPQHLSEKPCCYLSRLRPNLLQIPMPQSSRSSRLSTPCQQRKHTKRAAINRNAASKPGRYRSSATTATTATALFQQPTHNSDYTQDQSMLRLFATATTLSTYFTGSHRSRAIHTNSLYRILVPPFFCCPHCCTSFRIRHRYLSPDHVCNH